MLRYKWKCVKAIRTRDYVNKRNVGKTSCVWSTCRRNEKVQVQYWLRRNGRLWVAQPMLQIGDKPSSFMENPVDIVDKDKIMEEMADKIATEDYTKK